MNFIENLIKSPVKLGLTVLGTLFVLIVLVAYWPVRTVPTGSRGVVTVGGAIKGVQEEGFAILMPWQKLDVFNIRAEQADIENAEGSTNDQQPVKVSMTVRYAISTDQVAKVYERYSHNGDLSSYVQTATAEVFKQVTARYGAPDLISKRQDVSNEIVAGLGKKLTVYGAQVISVDMRNFSFSQSYMEAVNQKVTQEQLLKVAQNKLLTVEAEQKQKVAVAQAEADAVKATADGEAYAKVQTATAEAKALQLQAAAISASPAVLELRKIEVSKIQAERWDGSVPMIMSGNGGGMLQTLDLNQVMAAKKTKAAAQP